MGKSFIRNIKRSNRFAVILLYRKGFNGQKRVREPYADGLACIRRRVHGTVFFDYSPCKTAFNADGNYWDIYHDAAIIEFPEKDRHFIVVVMTNKVSYQQIRKLGTMIETEFNKY